EEVIHTHTGLYGALNIGITDSLVTLPHMTVTHALAALKKRGPDVHINIHMRPADEVQRGVIDGRFQIGVIPEYNKQSALEYHSLYDEAAYLYCADTHPLFTREDSTIRRRELESCDAIGSPLLA